MELSEWVSDENPANGHRRLAGVIPERGVRAEFHCSGVVIVPCDRRPEPARVGAVEEFFERGQSLSLQTWTPHLTGQSGWSGFVERGVQSQPGDEGDGLSHGLAEVEQIESGVAAVRHHHDGTVRKPAPELEYHLTRPVGDPLVRPSHLLAVALGRSQSGQYRQCPCPARPGYVRKPHQAYPTQAGRLCEVASAGALSVSIYTLGLDASASPALNRLVYAKHQGADTTVKPLYEEQQQDMAQPQGRPRGAIENVMVLCEAVIVAESHDSKRGSDGAFARSQDGSGKQDLSLYPGSLLKQS